MSRDEGPCPTNLGENLLPHGNASLDCSRFSLSLLRGTMLVLSSIAASLIADSVSSGQLLRWRFQPRWIWPESLWLRNVFQRLQQWTSGMIQRIKPFLLHCPIPHSLSSCPLQLKYQKILEQEAQNTSHFLSRPHWCRYPFWDVGSALDVGTGNDQSVTVLLLGHPSRLPKPSYYSRKRLT